MNSQEEKKHIYRAYGYIRRLISDARRNIKKATESWKERDIDVYSGSKWLHAKRQGQKMNRMIW